MGSKDGVQVKKKGKGKRQKDLGTFKQRRNVLEKGENEEERKMLVGKDKRRNHREIAVIMKKYEKRRHCKERRK